MDSTLAIVVVVALAVLGFVAWPLIGRRNGTAASVAAAPLDDQAIERRIREVRAALRRGTVCDRCLYANPEDSRFCAQCGTRLSAAAPPAPDEAP